MDEKDIEKIISKKKELGKLIKVEESSSGGMDGGHKYINLFVDKKEIEKEIQNWYNSPIEITEYKIDEGLNEFLDYIDKYNFPAWSKIPEDKELFALDAPSCSISLIYENDNKRKEYYTIDYNIYSPGKYSEIFREFLNKFDKILENSIIKKETKYICPDCKEELNKNLTCKCGYKNRY